MAIRCLLVDDSTEFLGSAARLLSSRGIEVVGCATSGGRAVELAAALKPDAALVDVELGEEDGIELARQLTTRVPSTRVVLISVYERDELSDLVADTPAVGFLPKRLLGTAALEELLRK